MGVDTVVWHSNSPTTRHAPQVFGLGIKVYLSLVAVLLIGSLKTSHGTSMQLLDFRLPPSFIDAILIGSEAAHTRYNFD